MGENFVIGIVMSVYLIFMLAIGYFFKTKTHTFNDYVLSGRGLPWFMIAMTLLATLANATQVLGISGFSYLTGLSFMFWFFIVVNIFIYPLMVRLGSRFRGLNFVTIVDLAEERFPGSKRLTVLMTFWQLLWGVFSIGMCLYGGALLVNVVFGVPLYTGIAIAAFVTVTYTILGGLRAVVFTDLIQWLIIVLGTAFFVPTVFSKYGSFTEFWSGLLGSSGMNPAAGTDVWPGFTDLFTLAPGITVLGILAMGIAGSLWMPTDLGFMQRMLASKKIEDGKKAALTFVVLITVWATIMLAMGAYARILFPGVQYTDKVVILLAQDVFPVFGAAVFITAVAAAVMSTVSTYLNAGSAILVHNIYSKFIKPGMTDSHYIMVARLCTFLLIVAAIMIAPIIQTEGLFATALMVQMLICSSLTPMILFSTYWKKMSEPAAFFGNIIGAAIVLYVITIIGGAGAAFGGQGLWGIPAIFIGLIVSIPLYILISHIFPGSPESMGPKFRRLFAGEYEELKVGTGDIKVIGSAVVLILIVVLYRTTSDRVFAAMPPLSGSFAWLTNSYFYLAAAAVAVVCLYVLYRSIAWVKGLSSEEEAEDLDKSVSS